MHRNRIETQSRRQLLRFLAGSPLACALPLGIGAGALLPPVRAQEPGAIAAAAEAVNVFDFEPVMKERVGLAHYTYMAQGADDSEMLAVNRAGFELFGLRPRRLAGVTRTDLSTELFGQRLDSPIFLAPCGAQATFHPQGEVAVARAARTHNALQILSTVTNFSVEEVAEARGAPLWFQLYPTSDWSITREHIRRAERAGCTALALTVDIPARNMEQIARFRRDSNEACQACHEPGMEAAFRTKGMFRDVEFGGWNMGIRGLTWDYVDRLKDATTMNVLVKGIVTAEDAARGLEHGVDGIIVSNHGGRAEISGRSSMESLQEVLGAVGGRVPVVVDSGFRRGTDVFKALALGADGVAIGRPYLWGLGAFGQAGVERVVEILNRELGIVMQQMGTANLADIGRDSLYL